MRIMRETRGRVRETSDEKGDVRGRLRVTALTLAALGSLAAAAPAAAQGWIDPLPQTREWGVVKLSTDVRVRITGRVAEVEVEEWFENRGGGLGEGDYLYPLPGEAVFSNFSLYQGDQELRGETMDATTARSIYEEIVRRQKDPALIELVGHGLMRARVFPIEPGQRRKITLRYTQTLDRAGDALQFRYAAGSEVSGPGTGGPVWTEEIPVPMPRPREDVRRIPRPGRAPEVVRERRSGVPVRFTLTADAEVFRDPFSPTHELRVERRGGEMRVEVDMGETPRRGVFTVFLPLARGLVGLAVAAHRPSGEEGYFMLTLSPGTVEGGATPRDIAAVVDVSGSMSGEKMEQTRDALHHLLGTLSPRDRFRLVSFSNRIATSDEGWTRADAAGIREARRWVDGLRAEGGTAIAAALEEAFRLDSPEDRLPIVVFLTDGLPTVGEQDPERIAATAQRRRGRARVFAFGVGYDVNTFLLDRLGEAGRGSTEYVQPGDDVERALGTLAAKITHPVLTDLEIEGAPVRLTEIYPGELPDLFAGEELVLFGRYVGRGEGTLELSGRRVGRVERFGTTASFPARAETNDFIPRLWASRKLGELTRQARLNGASPELVDAIRQTALRYGLLSEYTSYLVQEPGALADGAFPQARNAVALQGMTVAPAPAPAAATGAVAVKASEMSRARREVASSAALDEAEQALEERAAESGLRVVGGRTFLLRDGVWMEPGIADTARVVKIRAFSDAYFALLRRAPELRAVVTELSPVRLGGRDVAVEIGEEGESTLSPERVTRLVADLRGR
ncbi:MAG: VIT and VWA domain-containing protein [Gemmatimonadetes bacterium]|nr:VIT and VWA domain-containing protein [Gemmatimonadota bacterium]